MKKIIKWIGLIFVLLAFNVLAVSNYNFTNGLGNCSVTENDTTTCAINLTDYSSIDSAYMNVTGIEDGGSYPTSPIISTDSGEVWSYSRTLDFDSISEQVFNEGNTYYPSITQLSNNDLAVAYMDNSNSNYGTFAICDNDGTNCVEQVFNEGNSEYFSITQLSNDDLAVSYRDGGNSGYGTFAICDSDGTNCVEQVFNEENIYYTSITQLSNGSLAVAYKDAINSNYGTFAICDSDGTNCVEQVFNEGNSEYFSITQLSNDDLAVSYRDGGNSGYGTFAICDNDGTNCVNQVFNEATTYFLSMTELSNGRLAVSYTDGGNSNYGTFAICDSDGTNCVNQVFNEATTYYPSITQLSNNDLAVAYRDGGNSNYGTFAICDSDGTNCVNQVFNEATTNYPLITQLSSSLVVAYQDAGNSNYGTFVIIDYTTTYSSTEATSDFSSSLTVGVVNNFTITADAWGKILLDALELEGNQGPSVSSITASVDPIQNGSTQTITANTIADGDDDTLNFYCSNTTNEPTAANTICTGGTTTDTGAPYALDCTYPADDDRSPTIWCRVYDGSAYSSVVSTSYTGWVGGIFNFSNGLGYCSVTENDTTTCAINLTDYSSIDSAYMDVTGIDDGGSYPTSPIISTDSGEVWSYSGEAPSYDITDNTPLEFDTTRGYDNSLVKINGTHYINTYSGGGSDGYAVVLTVDGTTVTNHTKLEFDIVTNQHNSLVKINGTHYINTYSGGGSDGYAVVLTVDGTAITNHTPFEFDSVQGTFHSLVKINDTHYLNTYRGNGNDGYAVVLIVDGTTVTKGTALEFDTGGAYNSLVQINSTHYLNTYTKWDVSASAGFAVVLTVDGTTITKGTELKFETLDTKYNSLVKINDTHYLNIYSQDYDKGYAVVLTVDGTAITNHTPFEFDSVQGEFNSIIKIDDTHYINTYSGDGNDGYAVVLTVDGTTVSGGTPLKFDNVQGTRNSLIQINNTHYLNTYYGDGGAGFAVVLEVDTERNMTFKTTESTSDFSSSLTVGIVNNFTITADAWGKILLDNINITGVIDSCTYSGSGDWEITISDNCTLSEDTELGSNILRVTGDDGKLIINSTIKAKQIHYIPDNFDGNFIIKIIYGMIGWII